MRRMIFFFIFYISGCTLSNYSPVLISVAEETDYPKMQHIRIERWGEVKFNGILAIRGTKEGVHYALIDGTGVKLLQAWADARGDHKAIEPIGPLAQKGIAPFISEAIARIYLVEPSESPCSGQGFFSVCVIDEGNSLRKKTGTFAGITYWVVENELKPTHSNGSSADKYTQYSQPWLGVEIFLREFLKKE